MLDEDVVLRELKRQEDERDALDKENAEAEMKDEAVDSEIDQSSDENMADSDGQSAEGEDEDEDVGEEKSVEDTVSESDSQAINAKSSQLAEETKKEGSSPDGESSKRDTEQPNLARQDSQDDMDML